MIIGSKTIVGIGSSIATSSIVGEGCIVSVGSSIVRDVPDGTIVEGVPGKVIGVRKK